MSSTNKTTHYDLPQWIGTDKPTFLGDLNGAFSTIDTQLYTAVTNAENANDNATSAAGAVSDMQSDVNNLKTWQTTASSAISGLQTSVNGLSGYVNAAASQEQSMALTVTGNENINIDNQSFVYKLFNLGPNNHLLSLFGFAQISTSSAITLTNILSALKINCPGLSQYNKEIYTGCSISGLWQYTSTQLEISCLLRMTMNNGQITFKTRDKPTSITGGNYGINMTAMILI